VGLLASTTVAQEPAPTKSAPTVLPKLEVTTQPKTKKRAKDPASVKASPQAPSGAVSENREQPPPTGLIGQPPATYAGGQVGSGSQVGFLGNSNLFDTPYSTTSFTSQTIQDQQARTVGDVLLNDPAVRVSASGDGVYENYFIRGFPVTTYAFYMNGLPGITPGQLVSPEFAERIEVLHGASALLQNAPLLGAVGGSINIVPKRATDTPLTVVTTSYASDGQFSQHLDFGRRYGASKEFGVRFNGVYRDGDTAIDDQQERLGLAALALDYRGDFVRLSLDAGYQKQRYDAPYYSFFYGGPAGPAVPPPASGSNPFQRWGFNAVEDYWVAAQGEIDIARNVTAYAGVGYRYDFARQLLNVPTIIDNSGNTDVYVDYDLFSNKNLAANAGINADFTTGPVHHKLRVGAQTQHVDVGYGAPLTDGFLSNIYNPAIVSRPDISGLSDAAPTFAKHTIQSVAIADTFSILDDTIALTVGVRQQRLKTDSIDAGVVYARYDESATTPSFGLVLKPVKGVSVYANYIEGLTAGPTPPAGAANPTQVFAPVVSEQREAGVKFDFGKLGATLALFQITQPFGTTDPATGLFSVNGKQTNRGIEFMSFGQLTSNTRILGGVAILDGRLTATEGGVDDGNTAPGVPDVQLNIGAEWDLPMVPGLTLTARAIYTSSQFVDTANTIAIPDWTRVDLGARYSTIIYDTPTTFRFMVQNITDESYWASAAGGSLTLGTPRRYLFSATAKF
jgi:iron complex outermembrane receptor protein